MTHSNRHSARRRVSGTNAAIAKCSNEKGFALMEALVSLSLIAVVATGVVMSTIMSLKFAKFIEASHIASSLAISKMEDFAAMDTIDIDTSMGGVESAVSWPGINFTFTRTTSVTINGDGSRTILVEVSTNDSPIPTSSDFTTTLALWE